MTGQRAVARDQAWPEPRAVEELVRAAARDAGHEAAEIVAEVGPGEWGTGAYAVTVRTADPDWHQPLIARVGGPAAEPVWHAFLASHGVGVPPVIACRTDGDGRVTTVVARTHEHSLIELISAEPMGAAELLALAGRLHVAVHDVPVAGAPPDLGPTDVVAALADDAARHGLADEHAWLARHRPDPVADPVVCHGALSPSQVRIDPADPDAAVVTTWTSVTVDARERDIAQTALTLWSIPHVAQRRAERMMLKMFRDTLVANYRDGYAAAAGIELDHRRLAWWTAAHALDWSIRVGRRQTAGERDPWDPASLAVKPDAFRKDLRNHFWQRAEEIDR